MLKPNAKRRGGPPRSSGEAAVMAVERRGWAIRFRLGQLIHQEEPAYLDEGESLHG